MKYRPDIDGVRAIAVLSVFAYHLWGAALPGGYVGVDVFFVISGFLISKALLDEIEGPGLSITGFYYRRMRRIAPTLLVVLLASLIAGYFVLFPGDYAKMGESAVFSAFGLANFFFYKNTGYFDPQADMQPLLHLWSLGVEEQFYLVWPLMLAGFAWIAKGRRKMVAVLIGSIITISFLAWTYKVATKPIYAFYHPQTRAWELAAGALLVFCPPVRSRAIAETLGIFGLLLIGCGLLFRWPILEANVVLAVVGSALLVVPKNRSVVGSLLSVPPVRGVGLISYSLYLWHWPLIVFFRHYANGSSPTAIEAAWIVLISFGLAFITWRCIEKPMRRPWGSPIRVIGAGLLASTVVAAAAGGIHQTGGFRDRLQGEAANMSSRDQMWEWNCPNQAYVQELGDRFCTFGTLWETASVRGVLWGDSHAGHMAPMLEAASAGLPVSFLLYQSCPAVLGEQVRRNWPDNPNYAANCARMRANALRWLEADSSVRIVVLSSAWAPLAHLVSQDGSLPKEFDGDMLVSFSLTNTLAEAARPGRNFILVGQVPSIGMEPAPCVVGQSIALIRRDCGDLGTRSAQYYTLRQAEMTKLVARVAAERPNDTIAVLPGDTLCQDGRCLVSLNGQFLYRDFDHLRRNLSAETRKAYASLIGLSDVVRKLTANLSEEIGTPAY